MKKVILFYLVLQGVFLSFSLSAQCPDAPTDYASYTTDSRTIAEEFAPRHFQHVDDDFGLPGNPLPSGLNGVSDLITAIDFDGDWDALNNWESLELLFGDDFINSLNTITPEVYYSVTWTETHWFIVYAFFHARDWHDGDIIETEHENDMEGILTIVRRPGCGEPVSSGTIEALAAVSHLNFNTYLPAGSSWTDTDDISTLINELELLGATTQEIQLLLAAMDFAAQNDINPEQFMENELLLSLNAPLYVYHMVMNQVGCGGEDLEGTLQTLGNHPLTWQDDEGHGVETIGNHDFSPDGVAVICYSPPNLSTPCEFPLFILGDLDEHSKTYALTDIFEPNGLWDHRLDPLTFAEPGVFRGDNEGDNKAHAPWRWDDTDRLFGTINCRDYLPPGVLALNPTLFTRVYFSNLGNFSDEILFSPYTDICIDLDFSIPDEACDGEPVLLTDNSVFHTRFLVTMCMLDDNGDCDNALYGEWMDRLAPGTTFDLRNYYETNTNWLLYPGRTYEVRVAYSNQGNCTEWLVAEPQFFTVYNGLFDDGVLPNDDGATYNYGFELDKIPSVNIESGGFLRINDEGPTAYLDEAPSSQEDFTVETSVCGSNIVVDNGGELIIGADDANGANRRGHLQLNPGSSLTLNAGSNTTLFSESSLTIRNGAVVEIQDGALFQAKFGARVYVQSGGILRVRSAAILRVMHRSVLIVEPGGQLIIDEGASVQLWDGEDLDGRATIHIKGELVYNGNFQFSGNGYFQFDDSHELTFDNSVTEFRINGKGKGYRFIRLNEDAVLRLGAKSLFLENGRVEYEEGARISMEQGEQLSLDQMEFVGATLNVGNAIGILEVRDIDIQNTDFTDLLTGIGIQGRTIANMAINSCVFSNCNTGILAFEMDELNIFSSQFSAAKDGQIALSLLDVTDTRLNSTSIQNYTANLFSTDDPGWGAINLIDVPFFTMNGGAISSNTVGIYAPAGGIVGLNNRTNIFLHDQMSLDRNDIGIAIIKGGNMGDVHGLVQMDCARMVDNGVGIQGTDILLQIDSEENCISCPSSDIRPNILLGNLLFDICYRDLEVEMVPAKGNYWGGGLPQTSQYQFRQYNPQTGFCSFAAIPLDAGNPLTTEPTGCPENGGGGGANSPAKECWVRVGQTEYNLHQQYEQGYTELRLGNIVQAQTSFQPIADIPDEVRKISGGVCQHYIDVSRAITPANPNNFAQSSSRANLGQRAPSNTESKPNLETNEVLLNLYPNPARDFIQLELANKAHQVQIFDIRGVLLYTSTISNDHKIDTSPWSSGIYVLKVLDIETGHFEKATFVIQKENND